MKIETPTKILASDEKLGRFLEALDLSYLLKKFGPLEKEGRLRYYRAIKITPADIAAFTKAATKNFGKGFKKKIKKVQVRRGKEAATSVETVAWWNVGAKGQCVASSTSLSIYNQRIY